ncbi:hypothetical protein AVEN_63036-1, partial [Araneus ventricosus]
MSGRRISKQALTSPEGIVMGDLDPPSIDSTYLLRERSGRD